MNIWDTIDINEEALCNINDRIWKKVQVNAASFWALLIFNCNVFHIQMWQSELAAATLREYREYFV